jgi:hypothetical protein
LENKSNTVAEMLGWEVGGEAWVWRRELWVWEEKMVNECQALLHDFSLPNILIGGSGSPTLTEITQFVVLISF